MQPGSPYLSLPLRSLAEIRGETIQHLPASSPIFLLGPDEVCFQYPPMRRNRWRKGAIIWAVVLACLVLGATVGPHAILYLQAVLGE